MTDSIKAIKCALISVSDKTGIVEFAEFLHQQGVKILSTGGTAKLLDENAVKVTEVSAHTGFPEMMDGRVKTLHPKIHGGILGRRGLDNQVMGDNGIEAIDLVVVNLYPFEQTIAKGCEFEEAIENIDIGGPAMIRSAAKNHNDVTVVVDTGDYSSITAQMTAKGGTDLALRKQLAAKVFAHTARYDGLISNYLNESEGSLPGVYSMQYKQIMPMRYGENPHQQAAFYRQNQPEKGSLAASKLLQGKALSYNNVADADAALECVKEFEQPACVIVKHANPCGVAIASDIFKAYELAYQTDPTSAFGGIIAFNRELDEDTARTIVERQFVEVIIAPALTKQAKAAVAEKSNIRVLETTDWPAQTTPTLDYKRVSGGLLIQQRDQGQLSTADIKSVSKRTASDQEIKDMLFAWKVVKHVKSNAIIYAKNGQTIGIGAGQMSRIYSARIAAIKAADEGLDVAGSVMASDAFFPFRDGIDAASKVGIKAVIQPGGSMRDDEVIAAADEFDMAMVFTGMRHFRH